MANPWRSLELAKKPSLTPAGQSASYSNLVYDLLADALVKASGKNYPQLLKQYVTQPVGMRDTTLTPSSTIMSAIINWL